MPAAMENLWTCVVPERTDVSAWVGNGYGRGACSTEACAPHCVSTVNLTGWNADVASDAPEEHRRE